ncbi:MAG: hypothetical protein WC856_05870 [Methylococcaceae bacterium]
MALLLAEVNGKTDCSCVLSGMLNPVSAGVPSSGGVQGKPCAYRVRQARQLNVPLALIQSHFGRSMPDRDCSFEVALF